MAAALFPLPIEETKINFCTPAFTARSIKFLLPRKSALSPSLGKPPIVLITTEIGPNIALSTSATLRASPSTTSIPIASSSARAASVLNSAFTFSFCCVKHLAISRPTPRLAPAKKM